MKELPFAFPPIEAYQGFSFIMGVVLAYPNLEKVRFNKYINLQCMETNNLAKMNLVFTDTLWDEYRLAGLAEMNLYDVANFDKTTLESFLCERLDQGNYLLLYDIDEYYISYSDNYKKRHYNHDVYIFGYTQDMFHVLAYRQDHLTGMYIRKEEVLDSLLSNQAFKKIEMQRDFCTFRPVFHKNVKLDRKVIRKEVKNYLQEKPGTKKENRIYGIGVYRILLDGLELLYKTRNLNYLDMRPFRCLMEHKNLMFDRVKRVLKAEQGLIDKAKQMVENAEIIFRLLQKYNMSFDTKYLDKAQLRLQDLWQEDRLWCEDFLSRT